MRTGELAARWLISWTPINALLALYWLAMSNNGYALWATVITLANLALWQMTARTNAKLATIHEILMSFPEEWPDRDV
jgi:hypothetical protein